MVIPAEYTLSNDIIHKINFYLLDFSTNPKPAMGTEPEDRRVINVVTSERG